MKNSAGQLSKCSVMGAHGRSVQRRTERRFGTVTVIVHWMLEKSRKDSQMIFKKKTIEFNYQSWKNWKIVKDLLSTGLLRICNKRLRKINVVAMTTTAAGNHFNLLIFSRSCAFFKNPFGTCLAMSDSVVTDDAGDARDAALSAGDGGVAALMLSHFYFLTRCLFHFFCFASYAT